MKATDDVKIGRFISHDIGQFDQIFVWLLSPFLPDAGLRSSWWGCAIHSIPSIMLNRKCNKTFKTTPSRPTTRNTDHTDHYHTNNLNTSRSRSMRSMDKLHKWIFIYNKVIPYQSCLPFISKFLSALGTKSSQASLRNTAAKTRPHNQVPFHISCFLKLNLLSTICKFCL